MEVNQAQRHAALLEEGRETEASQLAGQIGDRILTLMERAVLALESLATSQVRIANPFMRADGGEPWLKPGAPPADPSLG